jgi:hypothetical protein
MSKKIDILKHVELLDKVRIHIYRGQPTKDDLCPFRIEFECLDASKKLVFDESALATMNQKLTEKAREFNPNDPRFAKYLEEFSGRFTNELYRNGLVEIVDIPDAKEDPYTAVRKQFSRN